MSNILRNYSLKNHNTFGVDAKAKYFASFNSEEELTELLKNNICKTEPLFILGGGSNILLTKYKRDIFKVLIKSSFVSLIMGCGLFLGFVGFVYSMLNTSVANVNFINTII